MAGGGNNRKLIEHIFCILGYMSDVGKQYQARAKLKQCLLILLSPKQKFTCIGACLNNFPKPPSLIWLAYLLAPATEPNASQLQPISICD